jgi:deazaflavin-dependent oxidoreductase (nitroreductase family)
MSTRTDTVRGMPDPDLHDFNTAIIEEFRANGGRLGGAFARAPMCLLTTTGAKTGAPRTHPLAYTRDGDRYVVIASKGGSPTNPAWFHNLVANPTVELEVGTERFTATAAVATGAERERLWSAQAALMPPFDEYQAKTDREIPVVILTRTPPSA